MRVIMLRSNSVQPDPRVEKEANTLLGFGHKVKILAWDRSVKNIKKINGELQVQNGILPIRWFNINASFGNGLKNLLPLMLYQFCLTGWLIKHRKKYDVIHACDFDTVVPAWLCSRLFNKKYVYDIFDYYVDAFKVPGILKHLIEKIDICMINAAEATIIVNESRKEQISKSRPKKLVIIHNSPGASSIIDANEPEIKFSYTGTYKFVYIGILGAGRLLEEILEIFKKRREWELHIGGFGPYESRIKEIAEKYDNIIYYGKITYKKVLEIEQQSDVLFATYDPKIPNHRYSSPNKLYEAMLLGKPIIVTKGTGIDIFVEQNGMGKAIGYAGDEFEKAAEELLSSKDNLDIIKKNAKGLYEKHFSWDIMGKRLGALYNSLDNTSSGRERNIKTS